MKLKLFFLYALFFLFACEETYTPKPRAYFRVDFPEKEYTRFSDNFPYSFEYPKYAKVQIDNDAGAEPYWSNVVFPDFNARIHLSYKTVNGNFADFEEDTRKLAYKHTVKADAIDEKVWNNPHKKVYGILYDIKGNAASSIQFFLTDSTRHFLRGALYFSVKPNKDSLAPSLQFIRQDIDRLIETLEWKN